MSREEKKEKSRQEEFDEMLEEAMKNPGVATVMEIMDSLRKDIEHLEELERLTRPIIITTTSTGTAP